MESNSYHTKDSDNSLNPLLSVIVPVYNVGQYLSECIDSILGQSYANIEVLLIDDGSNDGSAQLCDEYGLKDTRVRIIHQKNAGLGAARNHGLDLCQGNYITFVDGDDMVSVDAYEANIKILESNTSADVLQYQYYKWHEDGSFEKGIAQDTCKLNTISSVTDKYRESFIYGRLRSYMPNKIFRRCVFESLRFDETILFEDRALLPDIFGLYGDIIYSESGIYYYRSRYGQITKSSQTRLFMESQIRANLKIVRHTVHFPELYDIALQRYSECWYWCKKSGGLCYDNIVACCPPLNVVIKARCAIGLKLKNLQARICPKLLL